MGAGVAESPFGERPGISGRGTGDSPHMQLLLQPRRRFTVQSPTCRHCPRGEGQSVVVAFANGFQHNTQHKVIAKDFALQIILFTLAYSGKKQ